MRKNLRGRFGLAFGRRIAAFCLPFAVALVFAAGSGRAQQSLNLSPDRLLQQYQQYQQNQGQGTSATGQPEIPQNIVIQPVQPETQVQLPPSRLEQIMSARAGVKLQQFGYDQLGSGRAVTVPQTGAVQDDYVLGPGDEIIVSLRGQENNEFRTTVDRNGQVVVPRLSPIPATGRTFGSFRQDVEAAVRRAYVATSAFVSIGRVRQISVLVSGEVNYPGQRLVTGLSSAVDALLLSGGVKKTGSLRNIRIQRGGHEYPVDLYDVLTDRGSGSSLRLMDGDRVLVPPLGRTVAVTGLVRRPGIYELPPGQSAMPVRSLLALAGGQEVRGRYRLSLMRILPDGRFDLSALTDETGSVGDSEILFVQLGADLMTSQATLSGGTGLAGQYPIVEGTKLSDVIKAPGALGASPYTLFGIISRKDPHTLLRTLAAFTPVAVLNNSEDQSLQTDDIVRPLSVAEMRLIKSTVHAYQQRQDAEQEALRNPLSQQTRPQQVAATANGQAGQNGQPAQNTQTGQYRSNNVGYADNSSLFDQARSATDEAYSQETDIREIGNWTQQMLDDAASGRQNPLYADNGLPGYASGYPREPLQGQNAPTQNGLAVPQPNYGYGQGMALNPQMPGYNPRDDMSGPYGNSNFQNGQYPQSYRAPPPAANFEDQRIRPDVFPTNRNAPTFNILAQQLGVDPLVLVNFMLDHQVSIDGAVRGPGTYFVGPNVALAALIQSAGGTVNWADESGVELISTAVDTQGGRSRTQRTHLPLHQGVFASYIVQPHDEFHFNQVFTDTGIGSVAVQGEVRFAGTYHITRGEHLSELLMRAGGLTSTAYPYGTVFLRKSAADAERASYVRAAKQVEDELVVAMTRVGTDKISPDTFSAMQSFVNDLRNQRAMGRISIQADPSVLAAKPELDPLLEPGDVIYIPQRPSTISVLGQVMQPGSYPYRAGASLEDYVRKAGGDTNLADSSETYIVLPDGSARKVENSWLSFSSNDLPPGSAIVVPRDVTPLDLRQTIIDVSQIFSQLAVSIASVAVISR
jgi:protein involved in polysaccharide export with SLBB domain